MRCQVCQHENPAGVKFCGECGARIELRCPKCWVPVFAGSKFCRSCGAALIQESSAAPFPAPERYTPEDITEKILKSRDSLEGERKQITVLFADMKASMELLADRDPEEARLVLDPVVERMMEAVHRYEGTVNQVMGDGIMALFGAPLAHEDHGIRACYAALRMQEAMKRYAQEIQRTHGAPVQIRVGLNSGEVIVRTIGNDLRMDYSAVGPSTHLAARMEQAAMPGTILMGASTYRLTEGYVQAKALGKIRVKGLSEPVETYELTGAQAVRTRLQAATNRGLTRFVGRDAELERLHAAWHQAAAGNGQIVLVVGEPGVGKSRLFYEFAHLRPHEPWLILESGSVSYGKSTAYLPVIELLKGYFKIHDRDDHRAIREKVTGKLVTLDESLGSSVKALLALLDTPFGDTQWETLDPQHRRQRTLDAVQRLLVRECQIQPLLIVFEDLHGIDSETQAVLDALVEILPTTRILVAANCRPGYQHEWAGKAHYTELRIDPLESASAEGLLNALLGDDTALKPMKRLLTQRTGGNPFFLEESVRAFVETGTLVGTPGAYLPAGESTAMHVPSTVQPVIAARIDRLPPAHKQLLQAAAVIGNSIPYPLLHAIAGLPDDALRQGLAHLQSADFLYESGLFPDAEYTFRHALTHEVTYESLLHERQRVLHARIVDAIERLYPDRLAEHIDRLGHHALRGEVWDKAVSFCSQAGTKAAARSAHVEAVARFSEALAAIEHLPQNSSAMEQGFDLRFHLRTSLAPLGEFQRCLELLQETETIARKLNDQSRLAQVFIFKALYFWSTGQQQQATDAAEQALVIAQPVNTSPIQVLANLFAGRAHHARGDFAQAIELLNSVISATDADRGNFLGMANLPSVSARTWLAWSLAERGEFAPAILCGHEAAFIAEAVDHLVSRIYAYMALGIVHLRQGDLSRAVSTLQRAYQMSLSGNLRMCQATVAGYLGRAYSLTEQAANAVAILEKAIDDAEAMGLFVDQAMRLVHLSEAYLCAGQVQRAFDIAQRAQQSAAEYGQRAASAWAHWLHGEISARAGGQEAVVEHYRAAMALAQELGMIPLLAHCHLGLGKEHARAKKMHRQARTHFSEAVALYRRLEMQQGTTEAQKLLDGLPKQR